MGMLSVAGAVSGAGQALERGLGNTQLGMINMALQEQRDRSAAERDTVAYNRQRFNIEDERAYTKQIDADLRAWREKELNTKIQADQDLLEKRLKAESDENAKNREARMSEHIVTEGAAASRQGEELRWKAEREDRSHRFELAKQQADIGREIVLHSLRVQEARESAGLKGEAKLDPRHKAQIDFQMERLKGLQEQMKGGLLSPEEQQRVRAEVDQIGRTIDQILGLRTAEPSAKSGSTVSIVDPFAKQSAARPHRAEPSLDEVHAYINAHGTPEMEAVRERYVKKYGAPPSQELISRLRRREGRRAPRSYDAYAADQLEDPWTEKARRWATQPKPYVPPSPGTALPPQQ